MADADPPPEVVVVPPRPSLLRRTSAYFHRITKMYHIRRLVFLVVSFFVLVLILWLVPNMLNPTPPSRTEKKRDKKWIDSSPYWIDRQACRWLSLCGVHHLRWDDPSMPRQRNSRQHDGGELRRSDATDLLEAAGIELRSLATEDYSDYKWLSRESTGQESWEIAVEESTSDVSDSEQKKKRDETESKPAHPDVPAYVLDYAPLVHLFSGENFWPAHIDEHIKHMIPYSGGEPVGNELENESDNDDDNERINLDNLYQKLNNISGPLYLTSEVDVETRPEWLHSHDGIPVPFGTNKTNDGTNRGGNADAKNGHDYDLPPQEFSDDTTWHDVDRDHPLERISDPRKLPNPIWGPGMGELKKRAMGPEDVRVRNIRKAATNQLALGEDAGVTEDGEAFSVHGYKPDKSGYSKAPAILVLVDKGSGILDAFWFFFYSYNLGQTVLKVRYGNHVGDWEHSMTRFENGVPRALYMSEHAGGQAYAWDALEKMNATSSTGAMVERPVIYSAVGSHAMYALPGTHPYVLPFKMLRDETDRGPLWDPAKNNLAYFYDYKHDKTSGGAVEEAFSNLSENDGDGLVGRKRPGSTPPSSLVAASKNADAATSWFHFRSPWGDETYELGDARQWRLFGQYHYIYGPQGPKFKNLGRSKVCQTNRCRILFSLDAGKKASWYS